MTTSISTLKQSEIETANTNETKINSQQKTNPLRLLVGKLVFLDLNSSYKPLNKVKECLNLIDAVS